MICIYIIIYIICMLIFIQYMRIHHMLHLKVPTSCFEAHSLPRDADASDSEPLEAAWLQELRGELEKQLRHGEAQRRKAERAALQAQQEKSKVFKRHVFEVSLKPFLMDF